MAERPTASTPTIKAISILRLLTITALLSGALVSTAVSSFGPKQNKLEKNLRHRRVPDLTAAHNSPTSEEHDGDVSGAPVIGKISNSGENGRFLQECTIDCCRTLDEFSEGESTEETWITAVPFSVQIIMTAFLLALSALFSGLTLGLMSLDLTGLEIVMAGEDEKDAKSASIIYPVRKNGNLLLCTLLLGNVAVNALLSIILAEVAGGTVGFLSSTFLIVIFGEIVPQALCSRYALAIGSVAVPIVKIIRCLVWPAAAPLAWCLDKALGRELASTYTTAEMLKLLQIHQQENILDKETAGAMTGALTFKDMLVKNIMTPLERTFMLNVDEKLSFETIAKIFRTGYSRIPVYEVSPNNIVGLLFVKDLIFVDPEDDTPIRNFIQIFGRSVHVVWPDDKLGAVLAELKQGRSHLALVRDVNNSDPSKDAFYEVKGIVTLEDIIEKIIGDSIVDETDAFMDNSQSTKVDRGEGFDWSRLRLLDAKIVDEMLSIHESKAVTAHLRVNHEATFGRLTDTQLQRLVAGTPVSNVATAVRAVGDDLPDELLYEKGTESDVCTLILSGKVAVLVGSDNFRSDVSSWSVLGTSALTGTSYTPDFSAYVSDGPCRCLRITRERFIAAMDASVIERQHADNPLVGAPNIIEPIGPKSPHARREKLITAMRMFKQASSSNDDQENSELMPIIEKPDGETDEQSSSSPAISSTKDDVPPTSIESDMSLDGVKPGANDNDKSDD